jgi:hypothetical protein
MDDHANYDCRCQPHHSDKCLVRRAKAALADLQEVMREARIAGLHFTIESTHEPVSIGQFRVSGWSMIDTKLSASRTIHYES